MANKKEEFDVIFASTAEDGTKIITSTERGQQWLDNAMATYDPTNQMFSAYLNDTGSAQTLSQSIITSLGDNAQNNLDNIVQINQIVRKYVNINDLIGMVVQSITNNINTEFRLSYQNFGEQRNKVSTLKKVRALVDDFNEQVNIEQFICDAITITYLEGNYAALLRNNQTNWQIDFLPLSVIENSGYESNGNPVLLMNIDNLKTALNKTLIKNKKGSYLFFKNVEEEIKANYPEEVLTAYKNKEKYAVLDSNYTGMARVNSFGRKYGLTPIFRALSPTLILDEYQTADESSAQAKSKKIIHQKLREKCLGTDGTRKAFEEMAFSHQQLMQAWRNKTVIITTNPAVESIEYVEPKQEDISTDKINIYRNKVLSSLGVAFLAADRSQTASTANINLSQLMKCINRISKQVETIIEHFYSTLLTANGYDLAYRPSIKVIDSELLEMDMKLELSKLLYATFGCSRDTALNVIGIDVKDEKAKREQEIADGYDDVFIPYGTAYNTQGYVTNPAKPESSPGRPSTTDDDDKGNYDKTYNESR